MPPKTPLKVIEAIKAMNFPDMQIDMPLILISGFPERIITQLTQEVVKSKRIETLLDLLIWYKAGKIKDVPGFKSEDSQCSRVLAQILKTNPGLLDDPELINECEARFQKRES